MEQEFFETSYRFKWGTGFIIEFLTGSLRYARANHPELLKDLELAFELEKIRYIYDPNTGEFEETDQLAQNRYSTETNFVLELSSREEFDALVTIGNEYLLEFKQQLINEFQEETERTAELHRLYDDMNNFDAILTYTDLTIDWMGQNSLVIQDPNPQKIKDDQYFMG